MTIETIELNAGTGGATVAVDTVGGKSYQIVKVDVGADGSEALLSNSNPVPVSDAGGTLTVDGTVAVTNAGLTELAAAINGSSQMDVNIAASNATVAVSNAGLTALNGAISGTEVQVDVLTMPTVTVNSHAVTNAGTFVVQENGSALTALQLIDDTVYVDDADWTDNTSKHVLVGGVYQSSQHTVTDGDVSPLAVDSNGNLRVNIVAGAAAGGTSVADDADFTDGTTSLTPIGGVYESTPTTVTDGDIGMAGITDDRSLKVYITGISGSQTDDAAFTPGTSLVSVIGAEFDDSSPDSVDEGDGGALRMSGRRELYIQLRDAAGNERGANVNASGQVAVAGPVTNAGTFAVQVDGNALTALQLIDDPVATLGTTTYTETTTKGMIVGAVRRDADTTLVDTTNEIGPLQMDANGRLKVEAFSGETLPVSLAALPASTNTIEVVGDVAHDAGVAGNPVQTGGYASNNIEGVTQVANGDLTRTVHDLNGVQVVRPHTTLEEIQSVRTTNTDGNSTSLVAAAGSGVHNYLSTITIWNSSSTDGFVDLRDGTAGSVLYTLPAPQTGGCTVSFPVPLKFGDNTAIAYDASGAISTIYISAVFFQAQG